MGYYSDLRITLTKNDYLAMLKKDEKNKNICNFLLDEYESYIYEYKENNIDCVCIRSDSLKYYKEFSEIQMFEKYLSEAKSGYVFFRDGDRFDDIEYRNTAKYKELEVPFEFIDQIRNQTINQVKIKDANYEKTEKKCIILNIDEIIDYCKVDKKMVDEIKQWSKEGVQFKLVLDIDAKKENSSAEIYLRKPEDEQYLLWSAGKVKTETALNFIGYPNIEVFLEELNKEESQTENKSVEDEEDEELE